MDWQYIDVINNMIVTLVFVYGVENGNIGNFYFRYYNSSDHRMFFCKCIEDPVGYLQVV